MDQPVADNYTNKSIYTNDMDQPVADDYTNKSIYTNDMDQPKDNNIHSDYDLALAMQLYNDCFNLQTANDALISILIEQD